MHTGLDLQGRIGGYEFFERGDVAAVVPLAAELLGKGALDRPVLRQQGQLTHRAFPLLLERQPFDVVQLRITGELARR